MLFETKRDLKEVISEIRTVVEDRLTVGTVELAGWCGKTEQSWGANAYADVSRLDFDSQSLSYPFSDPRHREDQPLCQVLFTLLHN